MSVFASSATTSSLPDEVTAEDPAAPSFPFTPISLSNAKICEQPAPAGSFLRSRHVRRIATSACLVIGDIASYLLAYCALLPFFWSTGTEVASLDRIFILAVAAVLVFHASTGLYPGYRLHNHEHLRRRTIVCVKVAVLAMIAAVLLLESPWPLLAVIGFLGLGLMIQPLMHGLARSLCRRLGLWGEPAVLIASVDRLPALMAHFTEHWQFGIHPQRVSPDAPGVPGVNRPSIALIAGDAGSAIAELATMRRRFSEVILLSDTQTLKINGLRSVDAGGEIGVRLAVGTSPLDVYPLRRSLDLMVAIPAALLATPLMIIAAAAIYAVDPGPFFFRHAREGLSGKTVNVLKLRTMYRDAEQRLDILLAESPAAKAEWSAYFKLKKDPRILPVIGHLLRASSFDELPQLVNVIAGEMAIVGPRPFPEYHLRAMDSEFRDKRCSIPPGLTGLWQISERSNAGLCLQQQLDDFYIDNRSFWFDWHILLRTIPVIFKSKGAY
jgi:lipopolysaccharide/colanic/teichoic acid biosynthesis glycosyltransferase